MLRTFSFDGYKQTYIDVGPSDPNASVFIFVHGTPVSSSEFEETINRLKSKARCLALDHLGFGDSDKPPTANYTVAAHRERLIAWIHSLNLKEFHLVVTDFGGPIALPLMVNAQLKKKDGPSPIIKSVTLMNTWGWSLPTVETQLKKLKWIMTSFLMKWFYLYLNFSARFMIKMAWGKHRPLSKERHLFYQNKFKASSERKGTWALVGEVFESDVEARTCGEDISKSWNGPTQIIWGSADSFISRKNLERWQALLPKAKVTELSDVGHFVSEEAPEEVSEQLIALCNINH